MGLLKSIRGINELAQAFNGVYQMLQPFVNSQEICFQEDLFSIAYICRKEIIDRIDSCNFRMEALIIVPMISSTSVTILNAYQQTIGQLFAISAEKGYLEDVSEILEKGELYTTVENKIAESLRNMR